MSFPIRCYIVQRGPFGDDLQTVLAHSSSDLEKTIITAVAKQAAISIAMQISLMCIPIAGQALAGLMSLTQSIVGKYYSKQMTDVIAQTMDDIKTRSLAVQQRVAVAGQAVFIEELPAARDLAMNGQPIDQGLGDIWQKLSSALSTVAKTVVKAVPKPVTKVLSKFDDSVLQNKMLQTDFISKGILNPIVRGVTGAAIAVVKPLENANIINKGTLTDPLSKARTDALNVSQSAGRVLNPLTAIPEDVGLTAKYAGQAVSSVLSATGNASGAAEASRLANDIHQGAQDAISVLTPAGLVNELTGRDTYLAARQSCDDMKNKAFAALDKTASDAIAQLQSPAGRKTIRTQAALAMRADPAFQQQLAELQALNAQSQSTLDAQSAQLTAVVGPPPAKAGAGTLVGLAAAVAAAFAVTR